MKIILLRNPYSGALFGGNEFAMAEADGGLELQIKCFSRLPSESWDPAL